MARAVILWQRQIIELEPTISSNSQWPIQLVSIIIRIPAVGYLTSMVGEIISGLPTYGYSPIIIRHQLPDQGCMLMSIWVINQGNWAARMISLATCTEWVSNTLNFWNAWTYIIINHGAQHSLAQRYGLKTNSVVGSHVLRWDLHLLKWVFPWCTYSRMSRSGGLGPRPVLGFWGGVWSGTSFWHVCKS